MKALCTHCGDINLVSPQDDFTKQLGCFTIDKCSTCGETSWLDENLEALSNNHDLENRLKSLNEILMHGTYSTNEIIKMYASVFIRFLSPVMDEKQTTVAQVYSAFRGKFYLSTFSEVTENQYRSSVENGEVKK